MSQPTKNMLLGVVTMALALSTSMRASDDMMPATAGVKAPITIKKGDCELAIGGKTKIESFFQRNVYLLNQAIPDEQVYIKHAIDINFDFGYGQERYGYKAAEFYLALRNKGVWGKPAGFADRESGPVGPSSVKLGRTIFGSHSHTTGKPLIWAKEAWLQFGLNAAFGASNKHLHFMKLGYFPFEMGRGIALGSSYGLNKEILGLYSYPEDKGAPGLLINGVLIQDILTYDLYYSCFENRSKSLSDTLNIDKRHILARRNSPWRGIDKNDDLVGGRLKWKALNDSIAGSLELEPYVFYNAASDQMVEIAPDSKANWGSYGFAVEHTYKKFEWGGEVAANYGYQDVFAFDRNNFRITNNQSVKGVQQGANTGAMVEEYSKIVDTATGKIPALVGGVRPTDSKAVVPGRLYSDVVFSTANVSLAQNGQPLIGAPEFKNADDRIRPCYRNDFGGWMATVDAAYTLDKLNLKVAAAYGYASGDINPHEIEKDKTYKGFVGLHEFYTGKRVQSVLILGERFLLRPVTLEEGFTDFDTDLTFSDLHQFGFGTTWTPKTRVRNLSLNPNVIFFWKAHATKKVSQTTGEILPCDASKYMGAEINLIAKCSLLKDLSLFGNFAVFVPGGLFRDITGSPISIKALKEIEDDPRNDLTNADIKRLGFGIASDAAYYFNAGLEYKF